jgi:hypothetical protein
MPYAVDPFLPGDRYRLWCHDFRQGRLLLGVLLGKDPGMGHHPVISHNGKRLHNYGNSPFLMGNFTINCHVQ